MIVCPDCRVPIAEVVFMEIGRCTEHGLVRWQRENDDDTEDEIE